MVVGHHWRASFLISQLALVKGPRTLNSLSAAHRLLRRYCQGCRAQLVPRREE